MRSFGRSLLVLIAMFSIASPSFAAPKKKNKTWDDPAVAVKEDPDFSIQGEYVGKYTDDDNKGSIGVQVIALGDGKFRAKSFDGGLPGAGWTGEKGHEADGSLDSSGVVTFADKDGYKATVQKGVMTFLKPDGKAFGSAKHTLRVSNTMGMKPPKGAVVLFNGKEDSLKNWKKGAKIDKGLLCQGVMSIPTFNSHTLHVEFRLPYKPHARGQGRGNSGLYMQGRFETQMLDSFGLVGKHNECGGIYSIKDPDLNMCLPPLSWQTYDIDFTAAQFDDAGKKTKNAQMTVRLNGVVVHKNVALPKSTTASPLKEGPKGGPVYLQNHGNPVRFRNIWILPKD